MASYFSATSAPRRNACPHFHAMRISAVIFTLLSLVLAILPQPASAFETDQYNLPPVPLADIGDEVSEYVEQRLLVAIAKVNGQIAADLKCLEAPTRACKSKGSLEKNLKYLRTGDAVAEAVFHELGDGNLVTTRFGNWMRAHKFRGQPDRYKTTHAESIFLLNPGNYHTISETVRLFASEFGIDKLEHFFQQGYKYYQLEKEARVNGKSAPDAARAAIKWGQRTERTYYGLAASGVYSNADLYANYAGMRFYQGLVTPLEIDGRKRSATLSLDSGVWSYDVSSLREHLIKPFMTDHMNEAWNPSAFRFTLVRSVRRAIKKFACPDWRTAFPDLTAKAIEARTAGLQLWNREDYGFTNRSRIVRLSEVCYEENRIDPS